MCKPLNALQGAYVGSYYTKTKRKSIKLVKFIKRFQVKLNKFLFVDHAESPTFSQEDPRGLGADRTDPGGAGPEDARGRNGLARRKTEGRSSLADLQDSSSKVEIHFRSILQKKGYQQR